MYIKPEDVDSPRQHWSLIAVLDEGEEGTTALALGRWKDETGNRVVLAMRWNGSDKNPAGNPQSRGLPTWFRIEEKWYEAILQSGKLHPENVAIARDLLSEAVRRRSRFVSEPGDFHIVRYADGTTPEQRQRQERPISKEGDSEIHNPGE